MEPEPGGTAEELAAARASTRQVDVEHVPACFVDVDTSFLLGLADRCADPGGGPDPIPPALHEAVCGAVLEGLHSDWPRHHPQKRQLSATLHRASWALQNRESPATHDSADLARVAEGMNSHPHSLFALRSSGLVYSKEDRYVPAWLTFAELRLRLSHYERSYLGEVVDDEVIDQFREVQQQALLAETGTAARTVERTLLAWTPETQGLPERWRRLRYHEAFNTLQRGILTGALSADEVSRLNTSGHKTVTKAAIDLWQRRPGVMTARCHLELLALARVVEGIGTRSVPPPFEDWNAFVAHQLEGFLVHYEHAHSSPLIKFDAEHIRELVQLRLHLVLLHPSLEVAPVEERDDIAVPACLLAACPQRDALADWLIEHGHNANIAVSITAPEYLACMQQISGDDTLVDWMLSPRCDPLRRDAVLDADTKRRFLPAERRGRYDEVWQLARDAVART